MAAAWVGAQPSAVAALVCGRSSRSRSLRASAPLAHARRSRLRRASEPTHVRASGRMHRLSHMAARMVGGAVAVSAISGTPEGRREPRRA